MTDELLAERYQRLRPLGSGSMSVVWLADDLVLGREVAIKKVRTDLAAGLDAASIDRMSREARVAARLNHPHAVGVYDLVTEDAQPYLVMEYVSGESLAAKIRREGRLERSEAARVIGQVAGAVEAAHRVGIVHRDIKPANIMIDADGNAKLADFGIARTNQDPALTDAGQMIGTVAYMAPETARSGEAGFASDIWALGATLYAAVEGRSPYEADTGQTTTAMLLRLVSEPTPAARNAGPLTGLLSSMLDHDPAGRPTAAQARQRLLTGSAVDADPVRGAIASKPFEDAPALDFEATTLSPQVPTLLDAPPLADSLPVSHPSWPGAMGWSPNVITAPARPRRSRRFTIAIAAAVVIVLAVAGTLAAWRPWAGSSSPDQTPAVFAFSPQSYASGLVVNRTWTLSGTKSTVLQGLTVVANGTEKTLDTSYVEVIPKSVATNVAGLALSPKPDVVINADPVVQYKVHLAPQQSMKITYSATLAGRAGTDWASQVATLAYDQTTAEAAYLQSVGTPAPISLTKLSVAPATLTLSVGQIASTTVSGVMSNGARASALVLAGVAWTSSKPKVATVARGVVVGSSGGSAVIKAQAGKLVSTVAVTVRKPAHAAAAPRSASRSAQPTSTVVSTSVVVVRSTVAATVTTAHRSTPHPGPTTTTPAPRVTHTKSSAPHSLPPSTSSAPPSSTPPSSDPPSSPPATTTSPADPGPPSTPTPTLAVSVANSGPCSIASVDDPLPIPCELDGQFSVDASGVAISSIQYWTDTAQNPNSVTGLDGLCTTADGGCSLGSTTPSELAQDDSGPLSGGFTSYYFDVTPGAQTCVWVTATFADGSMTTSDQQCNTW